MQTRTIRLVLLWCCPTFVFTAMTIAAMATHFYTSLPFRRRLLFDETWMSVAALLPIATIAAVVNATALRFRGANNRHVWQPIVGWGAAVAAAVLNVLFYRVIADTLR
jgi:hypothetical protein